MLIKFIEIQNFRKLKSVRIDFNEKQTIFVGANNSGKTTAMVSLGHFLVEPNRFSTTDFTLSNWPIIERIGEQWTTENATELPSIEWGTVLPSLDLWINVQPNEIHHAKEMIPNLNWNGGLLGVRLRYEPKDIEELKKDYLAASSHSTNLCQSQASDQTLRDAIWPNNLRSFLDRHLNRHFCRRAYLLDPTKHTEPIDGTAHPQPLPSNGPTDTYPLEGLIRVDEISAQRGLADANHSTNRTEESGKSGKSSPQPLSAQLRSYYEKHLDPSEYPESNDLEAIKAVRAAEQAYDIRLSEGFRKALDELRLVNYPGVTDPILRIATQLRPTDGLAHKSAVQFEIAPSTDEESSPLWLPEELNGLGYQNLISIVFKLMSFRDSWMNVGKARKSSSTPDFHPPIQLVLVEEPEAHLHVQVQQVFVRQAYSVLRNHSALGNNTELRTQLIVSTHSSHIAHECNFDCLQYFRRIPSSRDTKVPTTAVINLSQVFGPEDQTDKFVERYLRSSHCDLFFADAAIFVEGDAERMIVPHFIKTSFPDLHRCYITMLQIGGSHAHRLRPLVEKLGLTTLLITDIDAAEPTGHHKSTPPERGKSLISGNTTLKSWHPSKSSLDELLDLPESEKVKTSNTPNFSVRVAYQNPTLQKFKSGTKKVELLATTFEDALIIENLPVFETTKSKGTSKKVREAIEEATTPQELASKLFEVVRECKKAQFALDLIWSEEFENLNTPSYIRRGLNWLQDEMLQNQSGRAKELNPGESQQ